MAIAQVAAWQVAGHTVRTASGAASVGFSALSGLEAGGAVGGILASLCTIVTLVVYLAATNRQKRQEYAAEIQAAEARGRQSVEPQIRALVDERDQARADRDFYRQLAAGRGGVLPAPPSFPQNPETD